MSKNIVNALVAQYQRAAGFYDKFIEICPDKIWAGTSGKFPVWQTVYHALQCIPFFLGPKDGAPEVPPLYPLEVLLFQDLSLAPADKRTLAAHAGAMNACAEKFFNSITDADLSKKHEGFSSRINFDTTNAGVITGLSGHHMYHFGACDAALRAGGLEGLF
jgi:hypothetical protein